MIAGDGCVDLMEAILVLGRNCTETDKSRSSEPGLI